MIGEQPLYAQYQGDANNLGSTSPIDTELLIPTQSPTQTTFTISPNPQQSGMNQTWSGTVTAS